MDDISQGNTTNSSLIDILRLIHHWESNSLLGHLISPGAYEKLHQIIADIHLVPDSATTFYWAMQKLMVPSMSLDFKQK